MAAHGEVGGATDGRCTPGTWSAWPAAPAAWSEAISSSSCGTSRAAPWINSSSSTSSPAPASNVRSCVPTRASTRVRATGTPSSNSRRSTASSSASPRRRRYAGSSGERARIRRRSPAAAGSAPRRSPPPATADRARLPPRRSSRRRVRAPRRRNGTDRLHDRSPLPRPAQNALFAFRSYPAAHSSPASRPASAACTRPRPSRSSAKPGRPARHRPDVPAVWYELTSTSVNLKSGTPAAPCPPCDTVSVAVCDVLAGAHACISAGVALFTFITKWKSCIATLPAPPPPPDGCPAWSRPNSRTRCRSRPCAWRRCLPLDAVELQEVIDCCHRADLPLAPRTSRSRRSSGDPASSCRAGPPRDQPDRLRDMVAVHLDADVGIVPDYRAGGPARRRSRRCRSAVSA